MTAYYTAFWALQRLAPPRGPLLDPELRRMRPYLVAIVAADAPGMWSLSRASVEPTYMVLGLVSAYLRLAAAQTPLPWLRLDARMVQRLAIVSVLSVLIIYIFIRAFSSVMR